MEKLSNAQLEVIKTLSENPDYYIQRDIDYKHQQIIDAVNQKLVCYFFETTLNKLAKLNLLYSIGDNRYKLRK